MKVFKPYSLVYKVLILTIIIYISSFGQDHTYSSFIKLIPDDFLFNASSQNEFSDIYLSKNVAEKVSRPDFEIKNSQLGTYEIQVFSYNVQGIDRKEGSDQSFFHKLQ